VRLLSKILLDFCTLADRSPAHDILARRESSVATSRVPGKQEDDLNLRHLT